MAATAPWPALSYWRRTWGLEDQRRLAAAVAPLLLLNFFLLYIIGDHPFAVTPVDKAAATESGSLLNRLLIFGTFAASIPLMLPSFGAALRLLLACWLGGAIVAWSCASFIWATHPDLTIRRGVAFAVVYLTLSFLVASSRSAVNVFRALAAVVAIITLLNIFVMVVMPAVSWSPIGQKGIFDAKNTAGTIGMLAVVMLGVSLFVARSSWLRAALAVIYLMSWFFLVLTRSKTSIGVAALMTAAGPLFYILLSRGSTLRFVTLLMAVSVLFGGFVAGSAAGVTDADLRLLLFGDLTFSLRTPIWADVVKSVADRPWLGYGFGSFWDIGAEFNPLRYAFRDVFYIEAQVINTAHSGYLDQLLQTGVIGLALGLAAILRCLQALWSAAVRTTDQAERVAIVGFFCIALCLVLNNFLESYLFRTGDGLGYLFFVLMLQAEQTRLALRAGADMRAGKLARISVPGRWGGHDAAPSETTARPILHVGDGPATGLGRVATPSCKGDDADATSCAPRAYAFTVILMPKGPAWHAHCPALLDHGVAAWGPTREKTLERIRAMAATVVKRLVRQGVPVAAAPVVPGPGLTEQVVVTVGAPAGAGEGHGAARMTLFARSHR